MIFGKKSPKDYNFRKIVLDSGTKILLGKNESQNESLVKKYKGKNNMILHTENPGSPFCVIENTKPSKDEIKNAAIYCARYSKDWRTNKKDVNVHQFTGKDVYKRWRMKTGTFGVKNYKPIKVKKKEIEKIV